MPPFALYFAAMNAGLARWRGIYTYLWRGLSTIFIDCGLIAGLPSGTGRFSKIPHVRYDGSNFFFTRVFQQTSGYGCSPLQVVQRCNLRMGRGLNLRWAGIVSGFGAYPQGRGKQPRLGKRHQVPGGRLHPCSQVARSGFQQGSRQTHRPEWLRHRARLCGQAQSRRPG